MIALILANLRERIRQPGFRFALALVAFLGYSVGASHYTFHWGEVKPLGNSHWEGVNAALFLAMFITFPGFYLVKNAISLDRYHGIGPILAASPLSKRRYIWSKVLGNAAYLLLLSLAYIFIVLLSLAIQDCRALRLVDVLFPWLWLALPLVFFTAAAAVLFEACQPLRGVLGSILYFVGWITLVSLSSAARGPGGVDLLAFGLIKPVMKLAVEAHYPGLAGFWDMSLSKEDYWPLPFDGIWLKASDAWQRAGWFVPFLVLPLLSALLFDRFAADSRLSGQGRLFVWWRRLLAWVGQFHYDRTPVWAGWIKDRSVFAYRLVNECNFILKRQTTAWYLLAGWLVFYTVFWTKAYDLRYTAFPWAIILGITVWPKAGTYELFHRTDAWAASYPQEPLKKSFYAWLSALLVSCLWFSGLLLAVILLDDWNTFFIALACLFMLPAGALLSSALSGGSRIFEVLLIFGWYIGPVKGYYLFANLFFLPLPALIQIVVSGIVISMLSVLLAGFWKQWLNSRPGKFK